ncbi:hypothetical protein [Solidesulfovibrio sp.]
MNIKHMPSFKASIRIPKEERIQDLFHAKYIPAIPPIEGFFNPMLIQTRIAVLTKEFNNQADKVHNTFLQMKQMQNFAENPNLYKELVTGHIVAIELTLYLIKSIINAMIQLIYIKNNFKAFSESKKIIFCEIKDIFIHKNDPFVTNTLAICKDEYRLLKTINDLHNSYKHCLLTPEATSLAGRNEPTINAFYAKKNDFSKPIAMYNESYNEIIAGFILFFNNKYKLILNHE